MIRWLTLTLLTLAAGSAGAGKDPLSTCGGIFPRSSQTNRTLDILAVSLLPEDLRTPKQLNALLRYKNEPEFATFLETQQAQSLSTAELGQVDRKLLSHLEARPRKTVDLKRSDLSTPSRLLTEHREANPTFAPFCVFGLTLYDEEILTLQAADTIAYDNQEFVLGDYLGAGNTAHIYAVRDNPNQAIRIPFDDMAQGLAARKLAQKYAAQLHLLPKDVPRVEVLPGPCFAYTLVTRVHGTENGRVYHNVKGLNTSHQRHKKARLDELVDTLVALKHASVQGMNQHQVNLLRHSFARHFIWDEVISDWIMVDWEF